MTRTDVFIKKGRGSVSGPVSRSGTAGNKLEALPPAQADRPVSSGWQWPACPAFQVSAWMLRWPLGATRRGECPTEAQAGLSGDTLRCPA